MWVPRFVLTPQKSVGYLHSPYHWVYLQDMEDLMEDLGKISHPLVVHLLQDPPDFIFFLNPV